MIYKRPKMLERQLILLKNTTWFYQWIPKIFAKKPIFSIFLSLILGIASVSHPSLSIFSAPKHGEKFFSKSMSFSLSFFSLFLTFSTWGKLPKVTVLCSPTGNHDDYFYTNYISPAPASTPLHQSPKGACVPRNNLPTAKTRPFWLECACGNHLPTTCIKSMRSIKILCGPSYGL